MPSSTRRTPKKTRGLHPCGKQEVIVRNFTELENVTKDQVARIGKIGKKKKLLMIKTAEKLGIKILNPLPKKQKKQEKTEEKKPVKKKEVKKTVKKDVPKKATKTVKKETKKTSTKKTPAKKKAPAKKKTEKKPVKKSTKKATKKK